MSITGNSFHVSGQAARELRAVSASQEHEAPALPASRALPASVLLHPPESPRSTSAPPPLERLAAPAQPLRGLLHPHRVSALDTAEGFMQRAGRPKDDIRFGFLGTYRMSTGYKAVLSGLNAYHAVINAALPTHPDGTANFEAGVRKLEEAKLKLVDFRRASDQYSGGYSHSRKGPIATLTHQIDRELLALQTLADEIARAPALPRIHSAQAMMGYARQGIKLADIQTCLDQGLSPSAAREHLERARQALVPQDLHLAPYSRYGIGREEAALLERAGLDSSVGQLYQQKRIPITERTLVKPHLRGEQQVGPAAKLGSGAFNTTAMVQFDTAEGLQKLVVKPVPIEERGSVAHYTGIDSRNPQVAMRNLCTVDVAKALRFDVIVDTELAIARRPPPPPDAPLELCLAMAPAKGRTACETPRGVFVDNAQVIQKLLQLQMLDHLAAQGDRHGNNYFVHVEPGPGAVAVTGIDNDQCWGARATHPAAIAYHPHHDRQRAFRGTSLPPVLDTVTANAVLALSQDDLHDLLADKLRPNEIIAAIQRLDHLQDHVAALQRDERVVPVERLVNPEVHILFKENNSYVGRELDRQVTYEGPPSHVAGI